MPPEDIIDILVRLRGGRRAAAEGRNVARSLDDIGDEAEGADRRVGGLNRQLIALQSTRVAGGFGSTINNLSGRLKLLAGAAILTAPAIIAVGSSLAAAAGGAALLGATGLTTLGVGLGGLIGITKQTADGWKKIKTALDAYRVTVRQYGRDSDQAVTAHKHLNAVVETFGERPILQAIRGVEALSKAWKEQTKLARGALGRVFRDAIFAASKLLPAYAVVTNDAAIAVQRALGQMFRSFSGPEAQGTLLAFGDAFKRIAGPLGRGFTDLLWAIIRLMRAALPYVVDGVEAFADWAHNMRVASSDGKGLTGLVGTLVDHFRSWWGLLKAVGRVLGALFGASADSGKGLVDSLTGTLNSFADWINRAREAGDAGRFFAGWADVLRNTFAGLVSALKVVVFVLQPVIDAIIWLSPAFRVLIPYVAGLATAVLGLRGAMVLLSIAFRLTPLGWIVTGIQLVIVAVVLMYKKWAWFRHAIDAIWGWIKTAATDTANWIVGAFQDTVKWIKNAIKWIAQAKADLTSFLGTKPQKGGGGGALADALGFSKLRGALGLRAAGGRVQAGQPYVVGEKRPELFVPDQTGTVVPQVPGGASSAGAPAIPQEIHLLLKSEQGKTLAEWMVQTAQSAGARA